jgi:PAS domain S-box-containing protein
MMQQGQDTLLQALDSVDDVIIVMDAAGRIVYQNSRASALLTPIPPDAGEAVLWDRLSPAIRDRLQHAVLRATHDGVVAEFTECLDLAPTWMDFRVQARHERVVIFGRHSTARVVREQLEELEGCLAGPPDEGGGALGMMSRAATALRRLTGWELAELWVPHGDEGWRLHAAETSGRPGLDAFVAASRSSAVSLRYGLPGRAVAKGSALRLDQISVEGGFLRSELAGSVGLTSALAIPVLDGGRPLGVMLFLHATPLGEDPWCALIERFVPRLNALVLAQRNATLLHHFFESNLDGLVVAGTDQYFRRVNDAFCRMLGRSREELLSVPWTTWIHPDDLAPTAQERDRLHVGEHTQNFENRYLHAEGHWRRLSWVVYPDVAEGLLFGTARDVTELRRATAIEALHREALEHLGRRAPLTEILTDLVHSTEALVDGARGSIVLVREGRIHLGAAPHLPAGYSEAIEGEPIGPQAGSCGTAAWRNEPVITTDIATDPLWERYRDAALRHGLVACWSVPFQSADGAVAGTVAIYPDHSRAPRPSQLTAMRAIARLASVAVEHRRVDEELRLFQAAMENLNDVVMITDASPLEEPGPRICFVNPAFERMTGWSRADAMGRSPRFLQGEGTDRAVLDQVHEALRSHTPIRVELINVDRLGQPYWIEMEISPVRSADGTVTHFVAIERDVTERRQLEDQLRESQKMEAVGQLAGGIAHDFNNMLTAISGFAELLQVDLRQADVETREHVLEIQRAASRSADITRKLLAFSRRQVLQPRVVDLNALVTEMSRLLERVHGESIRQVLHLAPEPVTATVDPGQLEQVLLNLVVNARDAMMGGGELTIRTGIVALSDEYASSHVGVTPGRYAMLMVSDTGHGMTPEVRARIFEPFFTTKGESGGTGLGLSTVIGIVKQSGGHVWVYSEPGQGTTMKVYFPLATDAVTPAHAAPVTTDGVQAGTILVVEDEELLRSLVRRMLQRAGYTVLAAGDGESAEALLTAHPGELDLLLTDVVLPGKNGREVADMVVGLRPGTPVIFMSGYTEDAIVHHGVLNEGINFLEKPFTRQDLLDRITAVLQAR